MKSIIIDERKHIVLNKGDICLSVCIIMVAMFGIGYYWCMLGL